MADWNDLLKQARLATRVSRPALAALSGVSQDTVFSYETGRRHPTRETLLLLTQALRLDGAAANALLTAAGFAPELANWVKTVTLQHRPLAELQAEVERYSWPCLGVNERFEIVAWNRPATLLAELDFGRDLPEPRQRNLLRIAAMRHFRDRVQNWDEVVAVLVGWYKLHHLGSEELGEGSPYFQAVVADIMQHDGDAMLPLLRLWQETPPRPPASRLVFPLVWQTSAGERLRFNYITSTWDDFDAIAANDWQPADSATWAWFERRAE